MTQLFKRSTLLLAIASAILTGCAHNRSCSTGSCQSGQCSTGQCSTGQCSTEAAGFAPQAAATRPQNYANLFNSAAGSPQPSYAPPAGSGSR